MRLGDAHRRLRAATLVLAVVLSLFVGRLVQIQGLEAAAYANSAEAKRTLSQRLPAVRGSIVDASGAALATSVEARDITADQTLVTDPRRTAEALAPLLRTDRATLVARLTGNDKFVYLAKSVTPATWRAIAAQRLPGIFSEKTSRRVYPAGPLAANVVGFVGADGRGLGGLEMSLNGILSGRDGQLTYEAAAGGRAIPLGANARRDAVDGRDIQLTIDRDIQWFAEDALARKIRETGSESGYVVVLDARTGAIRAMASAPGFDPARPGDFPASARGNRAVMDAYEPGSTGKVITAAALIEERAVTPATPITVPNKIIRAKKSFKDFRDHETQYLTYAGTLAKSSNIGTIQAAERIRGGLPALYPYFRAFGLGAPTGSKLPGEASGSVLSPDTWSATTGYTMTFGQGYSVNALQMASVFATIANDGVRVTPHVVAGWRDGTGAFTPAPAPAASRVVSPRTATTVRTMLEGVTGPGGTAPLAVVPGYRIAGKTGTANRFDDRVGRYNGYTMSFIGMAPADDPRLVVAVTLQAPKRGAGGGSTAGPVFRDVMAFALERLRIPPTGARPPVLRLTTR